jgi:hypothetical protein
LGNCINIELLSGCKQEVHLRWSFLFSQACLCKQNANLIKSLARLHVGANVYRVHSNLIKTAQMTRNVQTVNTGECLRACCLMGFYEIKTFEQLSLMAFVEFRGNYAA